MTIVVLGGSPKGAKSVTMQYVNNLKANIPERRFIEHYVAADIRSLETDEALLLKIAEDIERADAVLWAFPVYYGLVHGSYKRFIELVWEKKIAQAFNGKRCAILATSVHFFDHTAIEYIRGISEDLGMSVDEVYSAAMGDLLENDERAQYGLFGKQWMKKLERKSCVGRLSAPLNFTPPRVSLAENLSSVPRNGVSVGLVTESGASANLDQMVSLMRQEFTHVEFFDLSKLHIAGGCLGCLKCGYDNRCVYEGKDDVIGTYRKLKNCDVIVFAGTIKDRYLSARWKTFIDRLFFTTHIPYFDGKVIAFLVSGPLRQLHNLRGLLTGLFETYGLTIGGIVTDEGDEIAQQIQGLASALEDSHKSGYRPPRQFPGKAGRMIFRDAVFGGLKGVFVADHKYYKRNGLYDFPQKNWRKRLMGTLLYAAMALPFVRKKIQRDMTDYMVKPYNEHHP